jgi:hypothetical protein
MGHRINEWVQKLLVPCLVVAAMVLAHFGFGVLKIVAIILPILIVLMLFLIAVDPGPKARGFVEGLRNRLR